MTATDWQRIEGAGIALAAICLAGFAAPGWPWWLWPIALLAPDLSMLGYLAGPRVGAAVYNAGHIYAPPVVLMVLGVAMGAPGLIAAGGVWLAHQGADRALGYGLKQSTGFQDTHLGVIGPQSKRENK